MEYPPQDTQEAETDYNQSVENPEETAGRKGKYKLPPVNGVEVTGGTNEDGELYL